MADVPMLAPHLSRREFLGSVHHPDLVAANELDFASSPLLQLNAARLFAAYEQAHAVVGRMRVTSGYRCDALNRAVGGAGYHPGQKPSAHMDARAIDVQPLDVSLVEAMEKLRASSIPFEKLIFEGGTWLHLQVPKAGEPAHRIALMWFGGSDYPAFNEADPRVRRAA